jgi:hypothetical protein
VSRLPRLAALRGGFSGQRSSTGVPRSTHRPAVRALPYVRQALDGVHIGSLPAALMD